VAPHKKHIKRNYVPLNMFTGSDNASAMIKYSCILAVNTSRA